MLPVELEAESGEIVESCGGGEERSCCLLFPLDRIRHYCIRHTGLRQFD